MPVAAALSGRNRNANGRNRNAASAFPEASRSYSDDDWLLSAKYAKKDSARKERREKYLNVLLSRRGVCLRSAGAGFRGPRGPRLAECASAGPGTWRSRRSRGEILRARLLDCGPGYGGSEIQVVGPDPVPSH